MRIERAHLTIARGNWVQGILLLAGLLLLWLCAQPLSAALQVTAMLLGYLLIYFNAHASAHWFVGRMLGIRFTRYSVGGSTHAAAYPPGMRQIFARLPFFAVHADKTSLSHASAINKALMYGAGMTSSVLLCTLAAAWCTWMAVPGGWLLLIANCIWYVGALIAELRSGDYAKAARALASSSP